MLVVLFVSYEGGVVIILLFVLFLCENFRKENNESIFQCVFVNVFNLK